MTVDVYIVIPKLFIRLNPIRHGQRMTPMPSTHYGFMSPLHYFCTTTTTYHIDLVGEAIHFLASKFETQVAHLMYCESHIAKDPTTSFIFICLASSFGNMRAILPTSAPCLWNWGEMELMLSTKTANYIGCYLLLVTP